jgi:hypothetical protein
MNIKGMGCLSVGQTELVEAKSNGRLLGDLNEHSCS